MRTYLVLKRLLVGAALVLLGWPAVQAWLPLVELAPLGGYAPPTAWPTFSWSAVRDNSYQPALESYAEGTVGFRSFFIRLRNQLAYSVFNVCKANKVLVGRRGVLLDEVAIRAYLGQDFVGEKQVRLNVRRLKTLQDTLARHGVLLVFAIAPDKACFYPEYHPAAFQNQPRSTSNYVAYARQMRQRGVNLLDFGAAFQRWKDTASYPLFPRGGIHWSGYGITLAGDSLARYLAQKGHLTLPSFRRTGYVVTTEPRDTDNDIARTLNLLHEPAAFPMSYPTIAFQSAADAQKPRLLLVGDSFSWGLIGFYPYVPALFNSKSELWYYNEEVQWGLQPYMTPGQRVSQLDRRAEILRSDVVLILFTQHNLRDFDKYFSETAFKLLCSYSAAQRARIAQLGGQLRQSAAFRDSLPQWAARAHRPAGDILTDSATARFEAEQP